MMRDPFENNHSLDIDFDTSYQDTEAWQGALKNDSGASPALESRANPGRIRFFYVAIGVVMLMLSARLVTLQVFQSGENRALAEGNRIREASIPAPRGVIYDSKRQILARNVPNFEVLVNPSELPRAAEERAATYGTLAGILKKTPQEIQTTAEAKGLRYGQEILLADQLDRETSILLRIRAGNSPGVRFQDNPQRQYAKPELFSHLLGYTGRVSEDDLKRQPELTEADYTGKTGLEARYDDEVSGTAGKRRTEVNAGGQTLKDLQSTDPVPGRNLVLSIDQDLQAAMAAAIDRAIKMSSKKATGGSAIALNPKNGEVLGMVSLPTFDNNKFINGIKEADYRALADDPNKPLFNRPIAAQYPPGSTFKIVTATAALAEGVVTPNTTLASPPELIIDGFRFPDWKPGGHGNVNVTDALAVSSDVYFYKVAGGFGPQPGVGVDKMGEYMKQYGIGQGSGIDLPDEESGLIPTPEYKQKTFNEPWFIGNTYQMGIGQGFVLTTPLEVANYTAAIAGGGIAYKPHLVKAIENADNPSEVTPVTPEQLINLKVEPGVVATVKEGMRQVVASPTGTGRELQALPVSICGKTGSAEFNNETESHAWFTAFAPCEDPQVVITVMIEGGGEGSESAVPAARSILEYFFKVPGAGVADQVKGADSVAGRIKNSD